MPGVTVDGPLMPFARRIQVAGKAKYGADKVQCRRVAALRVRGIVQGRFGHAHAAARRIELRESGPGCRVFVIDAHRGLEGPLCRLAIPACEGDKSGKEVRARHARCLSQGFGANTGRLHDIVVVQRIDPGLDQSLQLDVGPLPFLLDHVCQKKKGRRIPGTPFLTLEPSSSRSSNANERRSCVADSAQRPSRV